MKMGGRKYSPKMGGLESLITRLVECWKWKQSHHLRTAKISTGGMLPFLNAKL